MHSSVLRALVLASLLLAAAACARAVQVTDDLGRTVALERPPQRIVSLLPSLTEFVCALGACERLVAVDDFSNHPPSAQALPRVGGLEDARVEAIVALRPDLVLAPTSSRALDRLRALGLTVVSVEPRTFGDVRRVLALLAPVLGTGDASKAWAAIERGLDEAARELPPALRGQRVYFEVSPAPHAASESSFIGELLARAGLRNVVPAALGPFPQLNPEFVVRADPDVIMLAEEQGAPRLASRPGWGRLRAVRAGRICTFHGGDIDVLVRAGPRMAQGARLVVQCVKGELPAARARR